MFALRPHWIIGIVLATSLAYSLPSKVPPFHVHDSLVPRGINWTEFNTTKAECVGNVGLQITQFFLYNYIGHAFTIKPGAGYKTLYVATLAVAAIFLPYYGLLLACRGMENWAVKEKNALKRAGKASALCVVARTKKWRPKAGDKAWCWRSTPETDIGAAEVVKYEGLELEYLSQAQVQIHGVCQLPDGGQYALARLPPDYEVDWKKSAPDDYTSVSSIYSIMRPMIALIQLLSAVPTIYQAHKPESLESHGYAGYQLTVIPFALMSIINTITSFTSPSYGSSYMVESSIMKEACNRGAVFEGVIGELCESTETLTLSPLIDDHGRVIGEVGEFEDEDANVKFGNSGDSNVRDIEVSGDRKTEEVEGGMGEVEEVEEVEEVKEVKGVKEVEEVEEVEKANGANGVVGVKFKVRYPEQKERSGLHWFFHTTKKTAHFVFRQHIWEAVREEFPVLRWFLLHSELKHLKSNLKKHTPKTDSSAEQDGKQQEEPITKGPSAGEIERINPQRTCINRLFKRYSERNLEGDKKKTTAMILFPALGNPKPRKKEKPEKFLYYFTDLLFIFSIAAPYLITYGLTGYKAGNSSLFVRVIFVLWLVHMQVACIPQRVIWNFLQTRLAPLDGKELQGGLWFVIVTCLIWSAPGIIGFFFVMRLMINDDKDLCDGAFASVVNWVGLGTNV